VRIPAKALEVLTVLVHATLYKDLQLLKKSARWMIKKLLYKKEKKEQVMMCQAFIAIIAAVS
jgi:hypothetical protein